MTSNSNNDALREYVDRYVRAEQNFAQERADLKEFKADLKTEVKNKSEESGIDWEEVVAGARARLAKKSIAARRKALDEEEAILDYLGVEQDISL